MPRFINQDSYLGKIITPPSLNRYTYAYHNPTIYYDPNGHIAWLANLRDSMNNWATERVEASEGLNNTNSYSWFSKGMAGAAGLGAGMAELGALGISTVNYAANQASRGLNKLGIVSDETAAEHTAEVAGTHESLGQAYDAVSTEEGRSRIASSAKNTLSAAMSGDTGAIARTATVFAPGAAVVGTTAKIAKVAVSSIKSSKTVIKAVGKAKATAGQSIKMTVESAQNTAQKVNHVVKKMVNAPSVINNKLNYAKNNIVNKYSKLKQKTSKNIYMQTGDFSKVAESGRLWGQTEGSVYGMAIQDAPRWRSMVDAKTVDPGNITLTGEAAKLFKPHPIEGVYSGMKRLLGQYKAPFGDVVFDKSTSILEGNNLIIKNATIGEHAGQTTRWAKQRLWGRRMLLDWPVTAGFLYGGYSTFTNGE